MQVKLFFSGASHLST